MNFTKLIDIILSNVFSLELIIFLDKDTSFNIVNKTYTDNTIYHYYCYKLY